MQITKTSKKSFTLIEVMISMSLITVVLVTSFRLLAQFWSTYQDITAECFMSQFAERLKDKLETGDSTMSKDLDSDGEDDTYSGGLREAMFGTLALETTKVDGHPYLDSMAYRTVNDIDRVSEAGYDSFSDNYTTQTKLLKDTAEKYVYEYNNQTKNAATGKVKITKMETILIDTPSVAELNSVTLYSPAEVLLYVILDLQYQLGSKTYNYRMRLTVPAVN